MNSQSMQDYCLAIMGISQWQLKQVAIKKPYLLLLDETLNEEKNQLLSRLLQAMKWQGSAEIEVIDANTIHRQQLIDKITLAASQKVILFGQIIPQNFNFNAKDVIYFKLGNKEVTVAKVPAIAEMLVDGQAKKRAWLTLKSII